MIPSDFPKREIVRYYYDIWTEECEYDAGKKTSGIKRHIVVDTQGFPHAIFVTTANVTDREGALKMVGCNLENLSNVVKFVVDGVIPGLTLRMPYMCYVEQKLKY